MVQDILRNLELAVEPVEVFAGGFDFVSSQGRTVDASSILLIGRTVANGGSDFNQRRLIGDGFGSFDGFCDRVKIGIALFHMLHVPAIGLESLGNIFGEGNIGGTVDGNMVVVIQGNQLSQTQVPGQGAGFSRNPFHIATVTQNHIGVVVHQIAVRLIETTGKMGFRHGQADRIGNALPEGTGGDFHTRSLKVLRVTGGARFPLPKLLDVVKGNAVVTG